MSSVYLILAVNSAGSNNADGQLHCFHCTHLHGAGLRAEHDAAVFIKIKRIRPVAGGVAFLGVELIEVICCKLDLGAVEHGKAHADEYLLNFVKRLVHRVLVAEPDILARNGDIDRFKLKACLKSGGFELFAGFVNRAFKLCADLVCKLTHNGALLCRELAHLLEYVGKLALFAEILNSQRFKIFGTVSVENCLDGTFSELIHQCFHRVSPYL